MSIELDQIESSQRQHFQALEHSLRQEILIKESDFKLFEMLKPKISIDGNQYCVLLGVNLQDGIAGFGDTLYRTVLDFNNQFNRVINNQFNRVIK